MRTAEAALQLFLARLELRSPLSEEERAAILDLHGQAKTVDVEHDFVSLGDKVSHACLIVDGMAARFAQTRNGQRGIVALHIPGDMADLHSAVAPNVTWALHAVTPSTILKVPHEALRDLVVRYPAIGLAFWGDCVADATVLAQWTVNLSRKDAVGRVAHLLCEMALRYRAIGLGDERRFPFPITQANLADVVGLTPVHLNRVLMRLRDGIATKEAQEVEIIDHRRLCALGEFDPAYLQLTRTEAARNA